MESNSGAALCVRALIEVYADLGWLREDERRITTEAQDTEVWLCCNTLPYEVRQFILFFIIAIQSVSLAPAYISGEPRLRVSVPPW